MQAASLEEKETDMKTSAKIIAAVLLLLIGGVLAFIGITGPDFLTVNTRSCTETATATVTDLELHTTTNQKKHSTHRSYAPVYEYEVDGVTHINVGEVASSPAKYKVGDKITIHYDPDDPGKSYFNDTSKYYRIIYGALGGALLLFGAVIMIRAIKKLKNSTSI